MVYNNYDIRMIHKGTGELYYAECVGATLEEALKHYDFWCKEDDQMKNFEILQATIESTTTEYPYEDEDVLKEAFAHKAETIAKIEKSTIGDRDKKDLKELVEAEDAPRLDELDTLCRDHFWRIAC